MIPGTALVAMSVAAVFAVVSCDPPPPPRDPGTTTARPLTEREQNLLHDAEERLTVSCMASRGFRRWAVLRRPVPEDRDFPYVIDNVKWAARHGYGSDLQARREHLRVSDPNQRYFASLSAADRQRAVAALNGEQSAARVEVRLPTGATAGRYADGCTSQAQERLYGDLTAWFGADMIAGALPTLRQQQVAGDGRFKAAVKKWSACMRDRGLRYADPYQARAAFTGSSAPDTAARQRQEIRTAVAEAECARTSGLTATARSLNRRYDARLQKQYQDAVRDRFWLAHTALPRARNLLTTKPTDTTTTIKENQ
ncbi:hypothetical protein [Streptomyces phaeochromogenes]|uniref:hypothetical protein n=1 Tax=Streptomyces phaeochromogenes TaxID=1923 RepID=UPI002DD9D7AB|nr:hypothetical protein [Streptomyces phaeochromogenes]WRZ26279.1 hypothetical protein OG931_00195 [Streptomyces phaeochromogenes]